MDQAVVTIEAKGPRKGQPNYLFIPLPIQVNAIEAVLSCKYRRILFGGAAGVSKSHGLRWLGHKLCLAIPGFKVLLLRRKFPQLEESHLRRVAVEAKTLGLDQGPGTGYIDSKRAVMYPNGAVFKFGHCAEKGDEINYLSDEYDLVIFDEETTFEELQLQLIGSRARTTKQGWTPQVVGGTNPGGISANYCRQHYIDKNPDPQQYPHYRPDDYLYLPGTLDDNPYLNEDYERSLDDLPAELREAYRFGNWDIFPGQYFREWRKSLHVAEFEIPAECFRFRALDWGYLRPGVCLWIAAIGDGRLYVEDEYVFTETLAVDVAEEITARTRLRGVRCAYTVADPAMWIRSGDTGESIAETFGRNGVPLMQAKNERVNGWQRVRHWLKPAADGRPSLQVSGEHCAYLARTMPQLLADDTKPEDVNTDGDDHAADALRYGLMSRPPLRRAMTPPEAKTTAGALLAALRRPAQRFLGQESLGGAV